MVRELNMGGEWEGRQSRSWELHKNTTRRRLVVGWEGGPRVMILTLGSTSGRVERHGEGGGTEVKLKRERGGGGAWWTAG